MRLRFLFYGMMMWASLASAQSDDPVVMTIANTPVGKSEFVYSYQKNNSDGVIDKKTIDEYVDLFINYKLKVQAALDARLDTMKSFQDEFASYRDQQVRPAFITSDDMEKEARAIYRRTQQFVDSTGGLVRPYHILLRLGQRASQAEDDAAKQRIDSIYDALKKGADFEDLARRLSDDKGTAMRGGDVSWIQHGQTVKEFEDAAYALRVGEISKPVKSPFGYHLIMLKDKRDFFPYDSLRSDIMNFMEARGVRDYLIDQKLDSMVQSRGDGATRSTLLAEKADELAAGDEDLKNLIREYHDGLLLYEISNRLVWDKAAKDEAGQENFFKRNKKKYNWEQPRYKGIAYHVKDAADVKAVKKCVKGAAFNEWAERLRTTFNNDSVLRIRVEKGIFRKGDNALIDKMVFKKDTVVTPLKDYPFDAVFGKLLKKGPESFEDVKGLVTADYQEELERQWVEALRRQYAVSVNREVLDAIKREEQK